MATTGIEQRAQIDNETFKGLLGGYESHRRPRYRLADGGSVVGIVLAASEIGLHIARRHQSYGVTQRLKLAAPMMRRRAGLDANEAGRQSCEELQNLCTAQTSPQRHHHRRREPGIPISQYRDQLC